MSTLSRKQRDQLLVSGYVRTKRRKYLLDIPEDIIDSFFFKAGNYNYCIINEHKDEVEFIKESHNFTGNSCYGLLVMPSTSDVDIEYVFKLKIKKNENILGIGIDDAQCVHWLDPELTTL